MQRMLLILAVGLGLALPTAFAQRSEVSEEDLRIEIDRIEIDTVRWSDNLPNIQGLQGLRAGGRREYLRLAVRLKVEDRRANDVRRREGEGFISRLETTWNVVLVRGRANDFRSPSIETSVRMQRDVTYANVRASSTGEYQWIMLYLHPDTVLRFADRIPDDNILINVSFRYAGRTRSQLWAQGDRFTTEDPGGRVAETLASERAQRLDYLLMTRHETPWDMASEDLLLQIVPNLRR